MKATTIEIGSPRIFVTTYAAYNDGRQFEKGQWVDLDMFNDHEELEAHCREMYAHEDDPEFMVTDYENFPREWYGESGLPGEREFGLIEGYGRHDNREAIDAFLALRSEDWDDWDDLEDDFNEAYMGEFDSDIDFAHEIIAQLGTLDDVPENIQRYFDYESYSRDLMIGDYSSHNGHYFRDC